MNIGSLFKSIMGDAKPGEAKQVDLRAGQVVRGVVQSVSEDGKEAVVQIQGVKVNAKLETPLQAGQTAFMEVQPAAEDGSIVMKPVAAPPGAAAGAQSMEDTMKQLGMPDNKQNREMVRMMQQAEIPMTKENAAEVRNMLAQKPASVDAQQWVRSIGILQQRGLPITSQSVSGMQQAVFGAPASTVLQNLGQQVAAALAQLGEGAGEEAAVPGRGLNAAQPGVASAQNTAGNAGGVAANGQNPAGNTTAGTINTSAPNAGAAVTTNSAEDGNPAQMRTAAQTAASANSAVGESAVPDAAQTANAAKAAERTNSATGTTGANQAPTGNAAQQASQGQTPTAVQAETAGRNAGTAGATGLPQTDVALLRKVQTLLGELRTAAAGSTETANIAAQNGQAASQADGADAGPWVGRLLKMLGAEHEQQTARSTLLNAPSSAPTQAANAPLPQSAQPATQSPPAGQTAAQAQQTSAATQAQQGNSANTASAAAAATNADARPEVSAAVRNAAEQALRAVQGETGRPDGAATADSRAAAQAPAAHQSVAEVRETLKSLLLQLSASDSLPAGLKEAAQQAVQQMTGQQLLLNTDRTAPFAQVTMFLPFVGPDGNQTASVQIESRRGAKGELDASNCRLWFDLDMKSMGRTLIDVQVVDRKVSLNFRNDEEWVRPLLEAGQPQIASAFEAAGYQLLALRTDALPERNMESNGESGTSLSYAPPSYRGVDVKI
ncbi:hypothetical protein [Saccharibacillus sacchari]|uniref:Uncharacterized protein n=1 Tax=Saccharibacillus sacchari TaxID=456493 RepID=A0ACC6P6J1_9BACL